MYGWTFVCEFCEGTYISQYRGESVADAIRTWTRDELPNVLALASNETPRHYELDTDDPEEATPLNGLNNVFLWTFSLNYKKLWLAPGLKTGFVNIVRTKL